MKPITFDRVISFLFGVSWSFLLLGSYIIFTSTIIFGFSTALFLTAGFIFITLFSFILLEAVSMSKQRLEEAKKQTEILQTIEAKLSEQS